MKKAIGFELAGETAFFKKPDVNANVYFTYSHIPRVALLGLLGSILGYGGYNQQKRDRIENGETEHNLFPEFYQRLQLLRLSIVPQGGRGYFPRKIQTFNNSVGYASDEEGRNLIVKEQWLENPKWTIYIFDDGSSAYHELEERLLTRRSVFLPCLGKNDHPAKIEKPRVTKLKAVESVDEQITSLFQTGDVELSGFPRKLNAPYFYREMLPTALEPKLNSYVFKEWMHTNRSIKQINAQGTFYQTEERCIIAFY
jgi:CRISPR-associated protein Cas5h